MIFPVKLPLVVEKFGQVNVELKSIPGVFVEDLGGVNVELKFQGGVSTHNCPNSSPNPNGYVVSHNTWTAYIPVYDGINLTFMVYPGVSCQILLRKS